MDEALLAMLTDYYDLAIYCMEETLDQRRIPVTFDPSWKMYVQNIMINSKYQFYDQNVDWKEAYINPYLLMLYIQIKKDYLVTRV